MAIYLGENKLTGTGVQVDDAINSSSTNPVQNKVVAEALYDVGYSEWQKPEDWIDIRSGALPNSAYYLVAHSAPTESGGTYTVGTYPQFPILPTISNSGTYDVFVDGIKIATTASATDTTLDWGALYTAGTVQTIYTTTHPSELVYHVVRITPTVSTNTITALRQPDVTSNTVYGALWVHFSLTNAINLDNFLGGTGSVYYRNTLCEAITANDNELKLSGSSRGFARDSLALKKLPILNLEANDDNVSFYRAFQNSGIKEIVFKNGTIYQDQIFANSQVEKIITENAAVKISGRTFESCKQLKSLPNLIFDSSSAYLAFSKNNSLDNVVIDASEGKSLVNITLTGEATNKATGIKGLVVSNEAPFTSSSSPQLNVSYTGLNRAALVNLFKSMPTVSASQVCDITGATGASDLTASDLAIATGKGWSVVR